MYCKFNYGYINGLFKNINDEELLIEYITKKNDLINTALLINSTFNNVNIILHIIDTKSNLYITQKYKKINSKLKEKINRYTMMNMDGEILNLEKNLIKKNLLMNLLMLMKINKLVQFLLLLV